MVILECSSASKIKIKEQLEEDLYDFGINVDFAEVPQFLLLSWDVSAQACLN